MDVYRQLEHLALASLTADACPPAEVLAEYILMTLTGTAQLQVAAHVRGCPLCQEEIEFCRPPAPPHRTLIARLVPLVVAGLRSAPSSHTIRQYRAADLTVEITIVPTQGERWRVTGQILRNTNGVAGQEVVLRSARRRTYREESDDQGFFTFEDINNGHYTLSVKDSATVVQIRGIDLTRDQ